jgi:tight adherence protein B
MAIFIIPFCALCIAASAAGLAWFGWGHPGILQALARARTWQDAQARRLKALGAAGSPQAWRAPLIGLCLGWALGLVIELPLLAAVGWGLGVAWPRLLEIRLKALRLQRLGEQMPGLFETLASALRSGQSLTQALASSVEDLPEPSTALMAEALRRVRLGEDPELALQAAGLVLERSPLRADWRMLVTAVAVVRGSGGKLPEILDQLAATVRERQRLQAQVQAQTAQAKLSGWVIGCLPPALLLAMQIIDPELCAPLFKTPVGWALILGAAGLEAAGLFVMRRMAEVQV